MPNKIRHGNALASSASFTKAHGVQPTTCEMQTLTPAILRMREKFVVNIGGSNWQGFVSDVRQVTREGLGRATRIAAIDIRTDLFSVTVFGKFNMIDSYNGEVYSILERTPNLDLARRYGTVNEIPQFFLDIPANNWVNQGITLDKVYPRSIVRWLSALCGFRISLSEEAEDRFRSTENSNWLTSRYNVYNIDWNTGIKAGAGLDQILQALGLQVHVLPAGRTLKFSVPGEGNYALATWSGIGSEGSEDGQAYQSDVDTGVWIVGERNRLEWTKVPAEPAWNREWDKYLLDIKGLIEELALRNEQKKPDEPEFTMTTTKVKDFLLDFGFVEGQKFNEMTISEYLNKVVGRVYRIPGMDAFMSDAEFSGEIPVRDPRIATPLLSNPNKDYIVEARPWNETETKRLHVDAKDVKIELEGGYRIDQGTGHLIFDRPKLWWASPEAMEKKFYELVPEDFAADEPLVTFVLYGEVYRKFFGTFERAGSKQVSGLRKAFIIEKYEDGFTSDTPEFVRPGERKADSMASDIADSILDRRQTVRSGSEDFFGTAGHEPTGEVRRVSVSVDGQQGIRESVSYANDEPIPGLESQIELRQKLASAQQARNLAQLENDRRLKERRDALKKAAEKRPDNTILEEAALETFNRDNWVRIKNAEPEEKAEPPTHEAGDPVVVQPTDDRAAKWQALKSEEIQPNDRRMIGVNIQAGKGERSAVTTGIIPAKVKGPVKHGDRLMVARGGSYLVPGPGPAEALDTIEDSSTTRIPVRMGAHPDPSVIECYAASLVHIDEFPDTPDGLFTDFVTLSSEDRENIPIRLLVWQQETPEAVEGGNGIYLFNPAAPEGERWTKEMDLTYGAIGGRQIWVRYGKHFVNTRFAWVQDHRVALQFQSRFPVDHGSNVAGEIPAGLTEMGSGYIPSEGEIVYLRDPGGIFIALEDDWVQIGAPAPSSHGTLGTPALWGYYHSDLHDVVTDFACIDDVPTPTITTMEEAISPCALADEPEEEE
ncbi:MAG: hypothetical protein HS116_25140 [Planctomycetes bacterium]|nr:hypothetical protein [Planctomycetota bacterium]